MVNDLIGFGVRKMVEQRVEHALGLIIESTSSSRRQRPPRVNVLTGSGRPPPLLPLLLPPPPPSPPPSPPPPNATVLFSSVDRSKDKGVDDQVRRLLGGAACE
ncbi:hypothetical protein M0804_008503 [Polistes exclamans]|nr:hypothetical protein M0804_008503 [Polistes exclamans]